MLPSISSRALDLISKTNLRVTISSIHQSFFLTTKCTWPNYAASCNKNLSLNCLSCKIAINDENGYFSLKINI